MMGIYYLAFNRYCINCVIQRGKRNFSIRSFQFRANPEKLCFIGIFDNPQGLYCFRFQGRGTISYRFFQKTVNCPPGANKLQLFGFIIIQPVCDTGTDIMDKQLAIFSRADKCGKA